jgi:hypothetical protein
MDDTLVGVVGAPLLCPLVVMIVGGKKTFIYPSLSTLDRFLIWSITGLGGGVGRKLGAVRISKPYSRRCLDSFQLSLGVLMFLYFCGRRQILCSVLLLCFLSVRTYTYANLAGFLFFFLSLYRLGGLLCSDAETFSHYITSLLLFSLFFFSCAFQNSSAHSLATLASYVSPVCVLLRLVGWLSESEERLVLMMDVCVDKGLCRRCYTIFIYTPKEVGEQDTE